MVEEERREDHRSLIELKVEYKKMNTFFADYIKNISKGGTFIKTNKPLKVGTEFLFKLSVPVLHAPIEIKGEVVWVNREGEMSRPDVTDLGMGIRFNFPDVAARRRFDDHVQQLMIEALGEHLFQRLMKRAGAG